jgi:23S rRNA (cytosine1962-C5)-methyltransferase
MPLPSITLKSQPHERRHHPWVYDNEIATGPGRNFENGGLVTVLDFKGRMVGTGYLNHESKIAFRYLTRNPDELIDEGFWLKKVQSAYRYRQERYLGTGGLPNAYRLIHGEADGIPGLTVDIYGGFAVVQFLAMGLELWRPILLSAIAETVSLDGIYERSDSTIRNLEGLQQQVGTVWGTEPPDLLELADDGALLLADLKGGAKTGLFLDQLNNHKAAAAEAIEREVLNCFSYTGLFGLRAALNGAKSVTEIEASQSFNNINQQQWQRNNLTQAHEILTANVFDYLHELTGSGYKTDMIVLDPPAFTKKRSSRESAARGYNEINRLAMRLLRPNGILVSCSCSHHISIDEFQSIIQKASHDAKRTLRLIGKHGQPPDHPVLLDAPESDYLKCLILSVE